VTANTSFECVDPGTFVVVCNVCGCGWYVLFDQTAESKRVALRLLNRHYDKHTRNIDCSNRNAYALQHLKMQTGLRLRQLPRQT